MTSSFLDFIPYMCCDRKEGDYQPHWAWERFIDSRNTDLSGISPYTGDFKIKQQNTLPSWGVYRPVRRQTLRNMLGDYGRRKESAVR